jgi:glycosyltransferase involved in cell wall biosynthesis
MSSPVAADIVIPVFNEGPNIREVLESLKAIDLPVRVLICYDFEEDNTLAALKDYDPSPLQLLLVRNHSRGALGAVLAGFARSDARCVVTFPADDDYNGPRIRALIQKHLEGNEIVAASRFMPGGRMDGCPLFKAALVRSAAWFMYHVAHVPTRDASNGLRLFSRRVLNQIPIESRVGFAYSIELLVKAHRMGWPIAETPFLWRERRAGQSRFRTLRWLPQYLRWLFYALGTTFLRLGPDTVRLRRGETR